MRDRYWHIQMFLPEGKKGIKIDSSLMLREEKSIIGTGEWDDIQCKYFKGENNGLAIGDIVLVREGSRPLALCRIIGDCFHDDNLTDKYINYWFRYVEVLEWADSKEWNTLFSQGTLKILYKHSDTPSWNYINNWYKQILRKADMKETIDLLLYKHQIIFQGAPGTGKTYTAKDISEQLIYGRVSSDKKEQAERLKTSEQYKLIQFHPAYTYEDFVRGIVIDTENGQPEYITQNKVLGEFAARALKNLEDSKKSTSKLAEEKSFEKKLDEYKEKIRGIIAEKTEYPIGTTTARIIEVSDDSFKYNYEGNRVIIFNLLFSDLIKMHNSGKTFTRVKDVDDFGLAMKGKGSYYFPLYNETLALSIEEVIQQEEIPEKPYILIVDEINRANLPAVLGELIYALEYRDERVDSIYAIERDNGLVLPHNLYIIGTMNTADRSVGQIDYAIRRRFAFVDMLPKKLDTEGFEETLFKTVSELFIKSYDDYINTGKIEPAGCLSEEFRSEDVWIGHSYFIMPDKEGNDIKEMRIKYEIIPILKEYLKDGIFNDRKEVERVISELLAAAQE
ncbi:MAG: AAA family ATPase [Prevotella sp.]|jgi:hypothetical protein|nr:AAA family ATPase [Prevotella sp.]